jgi:hypothetical protein
MEEIEDSILISDIKNILFNNGSIYPWFPDWNDGFEKIKLLKERSIKIKTILNKTQ